MKKLLPTIIILSIIFIFLVQCTNETSVSPNVEISSEKSAYMPFPNGYGYPENRDSLENWITNTEVSKIREHAWGLWAGLNKTNDNGLSVWRSWYNMNQMYEGLSGKPPEDEGEEIIGECAISSNCK